MYGLEGEYLAIVESALSTTSDEMGKAFIGVASMADHTTHNMCFTCQQLAHIMSSLCVAIYCSAGYMYMYLLGQLASGWI